MLIWDFRSMCFRRSFFTSLWCKFSSISKYILLFYCLLDEFDRRKNMFGKSYEYASVMFVMKCCSYIPKWFHIHLCNIIREHFISIGWVVLVTQSPDVTTIDFSKCTLSPFKDFCIPIFCFTKGFVVRENSFGWRCKKLFNNRDANDLMDSRIKWVATSCKRETNMHFCWQFFTCHIISMVHIIFSSFLSRHYRHHLEF